MCLFNGLLSVFVFAEKSETSRSPKISTNLCKAFAVTQICEDLCKLSN